MKKALITLIVLASAIFVSEAEDLTVAGKTYYDIQLTSNRCDVLGISFKHRAGASRVEFSEMTEEDKRRFGYDPAKEKVFRDYRGKIEAELKRQEEWDKEQARIEVERSAKNKEILRRYKEESEKRLDIRIVDGEPYDFGEVIRLQKGLQDVVASGIRLLASKAMEEWIKRDGSLYFVGGKVLSVTEDGLLLDCSFAKEQFLCLYPLVFVKGYRLQTAVVDGDQVNCFGMYKGRYSYTAASGAQKTVACFYYGSKASTNIDLSTVRSLNFEEIK